MKIPLETYHVWKPPLNLTTCRKIPLETYHMTCMKIPLKTYHMYENPPWNLPYISKSPLKLITCMKIKLYFISYFSVDFCLLASLVLLVPVWQVLVGEAVLFPWYQPISSQRLWARSRLYITMVIRPVWSTKLCLLHSLGEEQLFIYHRLCRKLLHQTPVFSDASWASS